MPTSSEMELVGQVLPLLGDDRGTPEDIKKARELMSAWPESMEDVQAEMEEAIYLIENERD